MWRIAHRIFHTLAGVSHWVERAFTPAGLLVLGTAILAGVFGVDTTQSTAYRLFAFLAALLALALVGRRFRRGAFAIERVLPRSVSAGEAFEYRLRVRNLAARRATALWVRDELPDARPALAEFRAASRVPGYRGWIELILRTRIARLAPAPCADLAPGAEVELPMRGEALRRGRIHFTGVSIGSAEPLGLARGLCKAVGAANLIALPRRYALPPLALPGGRRYQQAGVSLASSVGDSEEFIGLRDYRPGDALQRVHWKSFARTGKPVVREYQDEYFERHSLILDTFVTPAQAAEFEEAVAVAASFACTFDTQECLLDLVFVGAEVHTYTAGRGQLQTGSLLEVLAGVAPCVDKEVASLADALRGRAGAMTGCVCILVGWDRARRDLVQSLRARGVELKVLCVSSRAVDGAPPWLKVLTPGRVQQDLLSA